jgi:hypothetical protein
MRRRIALAIFLVVPGLGLAYALKSGVWLYGAPFAVVVLVVLINALNNGDRRNVTPQELADELEKHLDGSEGRYDWDATTSVALADDRLNRLVSRLPEYDRLDTLEKREQFRGIIEALRRGEIPD